MSKGRTIFGIILIVIGAIFILDHIRLLHYSLWSNFWPIILIIIGIALIVRYSKRKKETTTINVDMPNGEYIRGSASRVFSDHNFIAKDSEIDGLNLSTVFGDNTLNLAGAKLKPGVNRIDISGVFGDITVIIPGGMEAMAYGSTTFGDIFILGQSATSGISNSLQNKTTNYETAAEKVHIHASQTFGDIKIYQA
jgi:predicted membrane protein